jgi:hypothetical protein
VNGANDTFQITHPFHPLCGQTFPLITLHQAWGEERVAYRDETGKLHSFPTAWTNLAPPDPFVSQAAGRSHFRLMDLLELSRRLAALTSTNAGGLATGGVK